MKTNREIKWLKKPEAHNYPAAHSYLCLIYKEQVVNKMVDELKAVPVSKFKAKDIFRAANVSLLGVSNSHVERDRKKIKKNSSLSPILLVRDPQNGKVIIADGYHRLCAVYSFDEDAMILCKVV